MPDPSSPPDSVEAFWFHRPPHEREAAAAMYAGVGLDALGLPRRPYNALRRSKWYPDVAALMCAGETVWYVRGLGVGSLRQIDAALDPLFRLAARVAQVTVNDPDDAASLDRALNALAQRADFDAEPWFEMPVDQRAVLATAFRSQSLECLDLAPSTRSALLTVRAWLDIGHLVRLDGESVRDGLVSPNALRDLHAGLVAHARRALEERELAKRFVTAIQAIAAHPELRECTMFELGWPARIVALYPGPTAGDLTIDTEALLTWWATLEPQPAQREAILVAAERLAALPAQIDAETWAAHWRSLGLRVVPDGYVSDGAEDLAAALSDTLRHVVLARLDEDDWFILQHRFGLGGAPRLTLAELGAACDLTRERVRQIESKVLTVLRLWLTKPATRDPSERLRPDVAACFAALENVFAEIRHAPMIHDRFVERCREVLGTPSDAVDPIVHLIAKFADVDVVLMRHSRLQPIWAIDDRSLRADIALRVAQVHEALTQRTAEALTDVEIAVAINAADGQRPITVADVNAHVGLCSSIEPRPGGRYAGRLEALPRMLQVERILNESGEPLHLSEIARRINHAAARSGQRPIKRLNLSNQMSKTARLTPIGRSGYWALRDWADVDTSTVLSLMKRSLVEHDRPMTPDEIHAWIAARRPVSANSVLAYLSVDEEFARHDGGTWGLARWSATRSPRRKPRSRAKRTDRLTDRVRAIAARTLADQPDQTMPLTALRDLLMRELAIPSSSVYRYLAEIDEVETWRMDSSVRKAVRWRGPLTTDG